MDTNCPHCERGLTVDDSLEHCDIQCPACGENFTAPELDQFDPEMSMCLSCYKPTMAEYKGNGCWVVLKYLIIANIFSLLTFFMLPISLPIIIIFFIVALVIWLRKPDETCEHCNGSDLIEIDSPRSKEIIKQHHPGYK